jgi:hypothetical protein
MFAMHYFFEGEFKLRMFLRNVSRNLKPGKWRARARAVVSGCSSLS